jgi:hypothetical protein
MYLPAGTHTVYAGGGDGREREVHVDALSARLLQSDLEELLAARVKPYIDFNHEGKAAAADPERFVWKPGEGVFLAITWTRGGRDAIEGRNYRYFEPTLRVDSKGEIEGLPANGAIGALVNKQGPPSGSGSGMSRQLSRDGRTRAASLSEASHSAARADPFEKMRTQRKVLADYRKTHPNMSTDEVFRLVKEQNPQLWKD